MNKNLLFILFASTAVTLFHACKKEIVCDTCQEENLPPVASAGTDQVITLPEDSATLDGGASTDPDGTIATYEWTRFSGPDSHTIANPDSSKTTINGLTEGTYLFELKVTDVGGLSSRDTVQVQVAAAVQVACTPNRSAINVTVTPVGNLSTVRGDIALATAGTKILFAGGIDSLSWASSRVDIYDYAAGTWSTAELTEARYSIATATIGTKIFFAGGANLDNMGDALTTKVDIYDASTDSWSTAQLSQARIGIATATLGDLVFFAGGALSNTELASDRVDIYNNATNTWSTATLSETRSYLEATVVGDKIYFAGGITYPTTSDAYASRKIDVYDGATNSWSTTSMLAEGKAHFASISVAEKIYWAGGWKRAAIGFQSSDQVEIRDAGTGVSTYTCLSKPSSDFKAVLKGDEIMFYTAPVTDNRSVDIYNVVTGTWSVGTLSEDVYERGIISVNNKLYVVKGNANTEGEKSRMVVTLEW